MFNDPVWLAGLNHRSLELSLIHDTDYIHNAYTIGLGKKKKKTNTITNVAIDIIYYYLNILITVITTSKNVLITQIAKRCILLHWQFLLCESDPKWQPNLSKLRKVLDEKKKKLNLLLMTTDKHHPDWTVYSYTEVYGAYYYIGINKWLFLKYSHNTLTSWQVW